VLSEGLHQLHWQMKIFYLQKSDRQAVLLLLCIIAGALALYQFCGDEEGGVMAGQAEKRDSTPRRRPARVYTYAQGEPPKPELHAFDPNTADSTELLRLGLRPWQVRNIYKFRAAGGVYREPRDLARLYGLTAGQYRQLEPYIRIAPEYQPAALVYGRDTVGRRERDTLRQAAKLQSGEQIALNDADTALLRRVPGIGPYFARRIVEYRERLGGYCRVEQLLEIEDFPEKAIGYFVVADGGELRKLNLNRLSLNELKRHPYVSFYQARAITEYRRLHGRLERVDQLGLLRDFPPEAVARLKPYVEF